jgi:hypothetical protein
MKVESLENLHLVQSRISKSRIFYGSSTLFNLSYVATLLTVHLRYILLNYATLS